MANNKKIQIMKKMMGKGGPGSGGAGEYAIDDPTKAEANMDDGSKSFVKSKFDGQGGPGDSKPGSFFDSNPKYTQPRSAFDKTPIPGAAIQKPNNTMYSYPGKDASYSSPNLKFGGDSTPGAKVRGSASKAVSPSRFPSLSTNLKPSYQAKNGPMEKAPASTQGKQDILKSAINNVQQGHQSQGLQAGDTHTVSSTLKKAPKESPAPKGQKVP